MYAVIVSLTPSSVKSSKHAEPHILYLDIEPRGDRIELGPFVLLYYITSELSNRILPPVWYKLSDNQSFGIYL